MSHMWQQNSCPNQKRHRIEKLSALLSKMRRESLIEVKNLKITVIKEPDALDAEPMNQ